HGAGAQRNDPKEKGTGSYPSYFGPQGDILYVNNFVRAVRDIGVVNSLDEKSTIPLNIYPNPTDGMVNIVVKETQKQINACIKNIMGVTMSNYKFNNDKHVRIDIAGETGIYFVQIQTSNGESKVIKIFKK
ncbi:MAG: T9SS type A sorting domain-containing protein, partial [Saprospiraceae bacterium]